MLREIWKDPHRRKGLIATALIHALLLLVFLFFGLSYFEPKPEEGIVINFGTSTSGSGRTEAAPRQQNQSAQQSQATSQSEQQAESPSLTQDVTDAPALESTEQQNPIEETINEEEETESETEQQPTDALQRLLQSTEASESGGGEGITEGAGDQGDPEGDPSSDSRTGGASGGGGGDGNYRLGNRKALNKPQPDYQCAETGRVVVKIYVDRQGKVTSAKAGESIPGGAATNTTSDCLFRRARQAALATTWQADSEAPETQSGYIIYYFSKS